MTDQAPGWTPYRAFYNNPTYWIDPTGAIEYESAEAFAKVNKGKTWDKHRGQGDWLKSDRENNTDVWNNANKFNLQQKDGHLEYNTITQRTAFYGWFQKQTDVKGYETKWAGAAYIVAQQMSLMDDPLIAAMTPDAVIKFANDGKKAIFDDVFDNQRDLYNGKILKGEAAAKWDAATLTHEQRDVVQPIYARQTAETIKTLQSLAQGTGFKAALGYMLDRRFPVGGPLKFVGDINNWQDRYNHGMKRAVPFYKKNGSLFNWNKLGDNRIDTALDPDNLGLLKYGEPKF